MKKYFGVITCSFVASLFVIENSFADPPSNFSGWEKVFEDNFEGTTLDKSKWNPTYNWGHTHNHRAYCDEANVIVEDGKLKLKGEAKKHPNAPATAKFNNKEIPVDYTSAAIDTKNHFEFKYGYLEGRFKAPWQQGTWPAFWTLQDGWPPEIDVLEIPASRKQHHYYLHYTDPSWYSSHGSAWDHEASFGGHKDDNTDRSADFHNYAVEWDESTLSFYFDDKKFASFNRPTEIRQLSKQYIIINLAIGGWAGDKIEVTADKPAYFESEWVRVWQAKPATPDTVRIYSMAFGTCMQPSEDGKLILGDCKSDNAIATITPINSSTYRINYGNVVVEIPNEKKDAGVTAGVYEWNGGAHQKISMEKQSGYEGTVVRMKMQNSDHYLRGTTDGARVVQDWNDSWEWNQQWRILQATEEIPGKNSNDSSAKDSSTTVVPGMFDGANVYASSVRYKAGMLFVECGSKFEKGALIRVLNIRGEEVIRVQSLHASAIDVKKLPAGAYQVVVGGGRNVDLLRFMK